MSGLYDEDGIDGPFEKGMAKPIPCPATREAVVEHEEMWGEDCPVCARPAGEHAPERRT